jgi:hypothetical protein
MARQERKSFNTTFRWAALLVPSSASHARKDSFPERWHIIISRRRRCKVRLRAGVRTTLAPPLIGLAWKMSHPGLVFSAVAREKGMTQEGLQLGAGYAKPDRPSNFDPSRQGK